MLQKTKYVQLMLLACRNCLPATMVKMVCEGQALPLLVLMLQAVVLVVL